jgi:hypothetical protein
LIVPSEDTELRIVVECRVDVEGRTILIVSIALTLPDFSKELPEEIETVPIAVSYKACRRAEEGGGWTPYTVVVLSSAAMKITSPLPSTF